ncbi:MAG: hypothetical protein IKO94_07005, partial [Selenomonadaceae bacterium]|nr:hypothetical protein [Selenomonadaceae bacterium]
LIQAVADVDYPVSMLPADLGCIVNNVGTLYAIQRAVIHLEPLFSHASAIIADPLYQPICPAGTSFIGLPQEGFSGRLYRSHIPNLIASPCMRDGIPELQKILG